MRLHKYKNDPEKLLSQGRQIISESRDHRFIYRVSMVLLMLAGLSPKELSNYSGDSERTLQTWIKRVDEKGWDSLIGVKQKGRPGKLTKEQIRELGALSRARREETGARAWDGPALSVYIREKYGIDYSVRACQLLLRRMGLQSADPETEAGAESQRGSQEGTSNRIE